MIIAVWIRAAAPGWRAIASTADATAQPCPKPHSPAAIAMPMPAAMTANGPIQLPVGAPSAANASPGSPKTASPAKISDRRTTVLLYTCGLLVMVLGLVLGLMLRFLDCSRDVEHRQHHEDERLEKCHQDLQRIEKADREHDRDGA